VRSPSEESPAYAELQRAAMLAASHTNTLVRLESSFALHPRAEYSDPICLALFPRPWTAPNCSICVQRRPGAPVDRALERRYRGDTPAPAIHAKRQRQHPEADTRPERCGARARTAVALAVRPPRRRTSMTSESIAPRRSPASKAGLRRRELAPARARGRIADDVRRERVPGGEP
jgi:hypothetical protein